MLTLILAMKGKHEVIAGIKQLSTTTQRRVGEQRYISPFLISPLQGAE
jgi:hypothetical protein